MEKLLNLTKRQIITVSWAAVAVGIAGMLAMGAAAQDQLRQVNIDANHTPTVPADVQAPVLDRQHDAKVAPKPKAEAKQPQPTQAQPQAVAEPTPAKTEPGGHVPFTNKQVTPGEPESYIDTVGQCPFYEMAGPKGCYPPSDIVCNDDWTVCKPVTDTLKAVGL